jgi:hypothetical protein
MSIRTGPSLGARGVALAAVALLLLLAMPVRGATSVELEVNPLLGGRYPSGGWLAVAVSLTNDGAPTEGHVTAETARGTVQRYVELPAGSRKTVTLYLRPEAFQRSVDVRFESADGAATGRADVRVLEQSSRQIIIVGDGGGNLRPQLLGGNAGDMPEPIGLGIADLPERPEPMEGIAGLVWAADSSALSEAQRRSLERWIASGGQLIVVGGPDWQARTAAFDDLMPVESIAGAEDVGLDGLADFAGAPLPDGAASTAALGTLRDGAFALAGGGGGDRPLLATINHGAGRVSYAAVDLATEPYRAWEGAPLLWSRILPQQSWTEQFWGPGWGAEGEADNVMSQALGNIPALEVPPAELLLGVIVGYILLIGPISYLVLRRLDRRELAWVTAPLLVVVFSACSYGIGSAMKGGDIIVNQLSIIRTSQGASAASVETYAGIFSPTRATYDLTVEADALVAPLRETGFEQPAPNRNQAGGPEYLAEQGDPAHLRGLAVGVFGFQAVRADAITGHTPGLEVTWRLGGGSLEGTVTNVGEELAEDVAVISAGGGERIGDLEPGESAEFTMTLRNFNGSSASEQIYGFGGWDTETEEQRRTVVRRQVIDSLVGHGGFPGANLDAGGGIDRGPFVIGWRSVPGPVAVTVDGAEVRRYEQVVEAVSGRPVLGPGNVELDPGQLGVQLISAEGEAGQDGPGFVSLGNGEVVFAITLPLEASDLQPTALDIVVGPDAGTVIQEPGGFGMGFFPNGYLASVRDVASGEWIVLGELSRESRFTIDDPASVLSPTGRIEVRIVGGEVDPNFGRTGVFASAIVSGVIDR